MKLPGFFGQRGFLQFQKIPLCVAEHCKKRASRFLQFQIVRIRTLRLRRAVFLHTGAAFQKALAAAQFAQYGMPSAPDEMLAGYAEKILADKEQGQKIYEKLYEMKVVEDVKSKITVEEKSVSADEFAKLAQELR